MFRKLPLFTFLLIVPVLVAQPNSNPNFEWKQFVETSDKNFETSFMPNYVNFRELVYRNQLSQECRRDVRTALDAFTRRQSWAVKLFNSWGKLMPSGSILGTMTDFGDYDQCLSIENEPISPQYCLVDLKIPMPRPAPKQHNLFHKSSHLLPQVTELLKNSSEEFSNEAIQHLANGSVYRDLEDISSIFYYSYVQIGVCLPMGCNQNDTEYFLGQSVQKFGLELSKVSCNPKIAKFTFNSIQLFALAFLGAFLLLLVFASFYDSFIQNKEDLNNNKSDHDHWLLCFSPQRNFAKLFRTSRSESELSCIHGLRVVTICVVIVGHALVWNNPNIFRQSFTLRDRLTEVVPQFIYGSQLTVDTFFFLSGLLTTYVTIKFTEGDYGNFNWFAYIVSRYLRLTPQLGAFMLLTFVLPSLYDGPIWRGHIAVVDKCYTNWWHNLIYLQNFIDVENICAVHTWFLSVDMQLHWLSLIPMMILLKNRRIGIILTRILILLCIGGSGAMIYFKNLPPGAIRTSQSDFLDENGMPSEYLAFVYKPWLHSFVFFLGFLFGEYVLNQKKSMGKQIELKTCTKYLLWTLSLCGFLFSIYGTYPWLHGRSYNPLISAIMYPLTLLTWTLGLALAIWLCLTQNGGFVGQILSSPALQPLSRMTYSVYLTHVWIVWASNGSRRTLLDLNSTHSLVIYCVGIIVCAYIVGLIFTILFESPLINGMEQIKRALLDKRKNKLMNLGNENNETMRKIVISG